MINYEDAGWRERGDAIVNGFLIEYFINPLIEHYKYTDEDFRDNSFTNARMFSTGKILFDRDGAIQELVSHSKEFMKRQFNRLSQSEIELEKYPIWDNLDNLKDSKRTPQDNFRHSYHMTLRGLLRGYCRYMRVEVPPYSRTAEYFSNPSFRNAYLYRDFPDVRFAELFMKCLKEESIQNISELVEYTLSEMEGFNIDGWKLRSPTTKDPE